MHQAPFLSIDGIDGTGKSTQCQLLADWLRERGLEVTRCVDPGGTPLGLRLREILLMERHDFGPMAEALLFMASRAELVERIIRPALSAGSLVLADRYLLATIVYQGHAGGLDVPQLWTMGRIAASGLEPDLTVVLDLPVDDAQRRRGRAPDRMEKRQREYHEKVRHGFLAEAERQPQRIRVVDVSGSVAEVHQQICHEVERVLATRPRT